MTPIFINSRYAKLYSHPTPPDTFCLECGAKMIIYKEDYIDNYGKVQVNWDAKCPNDRWYHAHNSQYFMDGHWCSPSLTSE
jgi:hypothetical protein